MPRIRSSDDEFSDSSVVRKLKSSTTTVNSPLRRSSRIKEIKEHSPKQLRGRSVRAASECLSPATKVTRRTRASSVDPEEVASPARPKRRVNVTPLEEEPDAKSSIKITTRRQAAVGKTTKPKENLDTSEESVKGTRKTRRTKDLDSSKESTEAEARDEEHSTKSDEMSMEKKKVLKGSDDNSSTEKEIRIVLERVSLDNQVQNESLKNTEIKDEPYDKDEIAEIISLDGSVSSSGISSILESDLGRRKQHFDFNEDRREKSKKLIEKYNIPLKGIEIIEISGPDTDAEVIVDEDDEDKVLNKDSSLIIPIYNSTLLCDKTDTDNFRKLFVNGSSPVAGTEDNSKEEKTEERPKTPLDDVVEVAESDDELFSPTHTAKKKSDPPVVETAETIEKVPSETDPVEKPEESQLSSQDSMRLCIEEKNTENEVEVLQIETPIQPGPSRRKSVTFALREPSQESNDEDDFTQRMDNFFNNRTPGKKFGDQSLFESTAVVDESEPMDHEDITSPEKSLKIGREDENKPEEVQAEKDNSVVNEKDETLGDISRKATKDSDSESLNSSFEIDESTSAKNVRKASEDSDDTSVKDSEKGEEVDFNRSRKSISKERRSSTKIDPIVEETENESDEKAESLNKSKEAAAADLNESRKSIDRVRKSSSKLVLVDSEDSVDDLLDKAVNKSLNKSKEDRQSLSKSIQEEIQSRRKSSEKDASKIESPQRRSSSRNSAKSVSSDEEEVEVSKLDKSKQEEPAKESQPEEIVLSSDKHSSDEKEDEEEREEMEVDGETVQSKSKENDNEEEDSPAFSPLEDSSDGETAAPNERKSLNASQADKTEETEDPKPRKSLNQSEKSEISRKSLEMEKENIENDKVDKTLDTSEKKSENQSTEIESVSENVETVLTKKSVTPQKRQSLQLEVDEEDSETLNKSRKSLNEIKALKEVSNSPAKERKSLPSSIKEICQKVELNESQKTRKSLDLEKEKKVRESLGKRQSMVLVDSEKEDEPQEKSVKSRMSLNQSKIEEKLDTSKSKQSLKTQSMEVDSDEEEEPQEKSIKARKSLNQSKVEKELETSKSRQSLKTQSMEVDSDEEEEPQEKSTKTRKSLNQSKVEKELETSKSRKSLNSSKKVNEEEADLSKSRKSLNQSKKTEDNLETSTRKSLNKSKKGEEDIDSSTNTDKSIEKSQDNESDEEESKIKETYMNFIEAVVTSKPLVNDSEDESVSIDEKDVDKTTSEDDDLDDEEEESLDSQDEDTGEIDESGVRKVKKSLEADFKVNESLKANKSLNKSTEKKEKSMNDSKAKIPKFMYSASESEDETQDEMDADILKEYNLDGETIVEYSDDDVIADDIRASETESSEDENDSDLADFIVDEVSEEEEEDDDEEKVSDEEEDGEDEDEENEKEEQEEEEITEEKQTEQEEKKDEVLEKSVDKKRKLDVAKIDEPGKSTESINKTILLEESEDENEVMNYDESCIIEEDVNFGKPVIKSILSTRVQMSTPNTGNKISRISKSFENVSALDSTLLIADADTSASKKSKSRKSESKKSLHHSLPLPQESSPEEQLKVKPSLSKTLYEGSETPVTKHLKKSKMNETEPIIKLPDETSQKSEKKKKKKSLGEAMVDIINTEVSTAKINDESLNKSSKKKDRTLVEENEVEEKVEEVKKKNKKQKNKTNEETEVEAVEEVEEVKKKNKKQKNKTNEVVEKKEKSKKKKVLEIEDVEVPSTYSIGSDKSEDRKSAKKANKKKQIEVQSNDTLIEEKPKKTKKRAAETETAVQGKRKRNESDESAKSLKNKQTEIASLKRRRDDLSASFSEVRIKKRQRTDDVKIVASASGSTTYFEVVPITKQKSKAPKALQIYRQRMLSRNPTQSATMHGNYQLKLKAAGRNRF